MDSGLEDFLNNCHQHCNVKLVCKDGDISSHKLIISRNSEFLKKLLWNIPVGDSVTLYLPDFILRYIKKSLCSLQSDKTFDREIGTADDEAENTSIQPKVNTLGSSDFSLGKVKCEVGQNGLQKLKI